eukprot:Gregarina_sp_Pseudo_9__4897@NODE_511_length_2668_cov_102_885127_g482_i0_p2_GENE_NODE_511_length_2668_cov_102_885127_g482_i0NODE_511_length_2668_cov_102_885127_g482_i0_p2_ORF_typecomplete_len112_score30_33Cpn10/PF00166_21/2_7e19Peptidase_S24/PF00717_23/0_1_NODE_511_length_2668_cov_102_885127_g482_i057392
MTTSLAPLFDRVLVSRTLPDKASRVSAGGILLPESNARQTLLQAKVLAKGPGKINPTTGTLMQSNSVKVGDFVVFPDFSGYTFKDAESQKKDGKEELRIIREEDILAVVKK